MGYKDPTRYALNQIYYLYSIRAKRKNYEFLITLSEFSEMTKLNCHYCNEKPKNSYKQREGKKPYVYNGLDRKDNDVGYVLSNVVPCCRICNSLKQRTSYEEWLERIKYADKKVT